MKCKICEANSKEFDTAKIMSKYQIKYFRCEKCGFIQTEEPYWLTEAYSEAITDSDIGLIQRNIENSKKISSIINYIFPESKNYLDYGGGYGIFTRMMRDRGFDFQWYDEYCKNLFAQNHEKNKSHYDIATAFELFEHLVDPVEDIKKIFQYSPAIIFSTEIIPYNNPPKVSDWWYYGTEHGQHISFYTKESLEILASQYGKYYSGANNIHIISDKKNVEKKIAFCIKWARIINKINRRQSLLSSDYKDIMKG